MQHHSSSQPPSSSSKHHFNNQHHQQSLQHQDSMVYGPQQGLFQSSRIQDQHQKYQSRGSLLLSTRESQNFITYPLSSSLEFGQYLGFKVWLFA